MAGNRQSGSGDNASRERSARESLTVLRAKYRDYCSARVFQIIQRKSPDEMFVFVKELARDSGRPEELSYDEMVRLATTRIYAEAGLPSFEDWVEEYRANPGHFDAVMLDLWRVEEGEGTPSP